MTHAKLCHRLEEKRILLSDFLGLTESLRVRLDCNDVWGLASGLAEREVLIKRIDRLDEEIGGIQSETSIEERRGSPESEEGVRSILAKIEEMLKQTRIMDQQCMDRLTAWRDEVKGQMQGISTGSKAVRQYGQGLFVQPKFLDVRK